MEANEPEVTLEECTADVHISTEVLNRTLGLLARWALRHGRKMDWDAESDSENLVTGHGIKGYGGSRGSN